MKKDLCELIVIIDESGSMHSVINDTIGGFNTFLETHQALPGEAKLTLVKFSTKYEIVHNGLDIQNVPKLDVFTYMPGGMTALIDAVGRTIDEVGKRLANTLEENRPEKVIVMIITDGEENSSCEYKLDQIKSKIETQTKDYSWEFIFLGADQNAWENAQSMGILNSITFTQSDINKTLKGMGYYSSNKRMGSVNASIDNFLISEEELDKELKELKELKNKK